MDDQFAWVALFIVGVVVVCVVVPTALGVSICLAIAGVQRLFGTSGGRSVDSPNPPGAELFPPHGLADRPPRSDAEVHAVNDAGPPCVAFENLESDPI